MASPRATFQIERLLEAEAIAELVSSPTQSVEVRLAAEELRSKDPAQVSGNQRF